MTELQRIPDPEVVAGDEQRSWSERVQAFINREEKVLDSRFENAREIAEVRVVYGEGSIEEFAKEVGIARSTAYAYREVWLTHGAEWGRGELPKNVLWTHYVRTAQRVPRERRRQAIEDAADEDRSVREHDRAIANADTPKNVETIETVACPKCGEVYPLREAEVRTEAV